MIADLRTAFRTVFFGAFLVLLVPLAAHGEREVRTIEQSYFAGDLKEVEIDVSLAALTVEGVPEGREAEVRVQLRCNRVDDAKCKRRAERIRLKARVRGTKLALRMKGTSRAQATGIEAEIHVKIPENLALEVDLLGGEVAIRGMKSDVELDSGGGDVDFFGSQDRIGTFKADVGFGKGTLWLRDSRVEASGWPRSITWKGTGEAEVEIDVGGGKITARLD